MSLKPDLTKRGQMECDDWTECGLTGAVGAEASQQLKADVSLHAHGAGVDLEDVRATLKQTRLMRGRGEERRESNKKLRVQRKTSAWFPRRSPPGQAG